MLATETNHSDVWWLFKILRPAGFGAEAALNTMIAAEPSSTDCVSAPHVDVTGRPTHLSYLVWGLVMDSNSEAEAYSRVSMLSINQS